MTQARIVTRQDIIDVVGRIDDDRIAAIIASGATVPELVEAYGWAAEESDALVDADKTLHGTVAVVYEILTAGEEEGEEH